MFICFFIVYEKCHSIHLGNVLRLQKIEELCLLNGNIHLALGVFDGVHQGHRAVIEATLGGENLSGVVTFDPHPIRILAPERAPKQLLASLDHKARLLEEINIDVMLALHFDKEFAEMTAENFIRKLVAGKNIKMVAVGEDWRFGKNRDGDVNLLLKLGDELGFRVVAVSPVIRHGERISSTRIRQAIRDGAIDEAAMMLGHRYGVEGLVVKGQQLGRTIGFPTANIALAEEQLPPDGVWAVCGEIKNQPWFGVANLGMRPTVDGSHRVFEVHLFDYANDLYGKILEVEFISFIRSEIKFSNVEGLKKQITEDANLARRRFNLL
jgi:riboflavin kinase / FMN adenylyltransferase